MKYKIVITLLATSLIETPLIVRHIVNNIGFTLLDYIALVVGPIIIWIGLGYGFKKQRQLYWMEVEKQHTLYKNFQIRLCAADPGNYNGKFVWEIWCDYDGINECLDTSNSIRGFEKEVAIQEAKNKIDSEEWAKFWKE